MRKKPYPAKRKDPHSILNTFVPTAKEGKYAAIYVRVSVNEYEKEEGPREPNQQPLTPEQQAEIKKKRLRQSVKTQKEDGIRYCEDKGWQYKIYDGDSEESGTLPADNKTGRKDLDRLMNDIKNLKVHTIVVRDIKRFSRSVYHLTKMIYEILIPNGVNLIARHEGLDLSDPYKKMFIFFLGILAENEIESFRENTMRNRDAKVAEGRMALHSNRIYGYRLAYKNHPVIVEEEAKIVRMVYDWYLNEKLSLDKIALRLEAMGVKKRKAKHWASSSVRDLLLNCAYKGKLWYHQKEFESTFPVIIDEETWTKVNKELDKRSTMGRKTYQSKNLLTGILKCCHCLEKKKKGGDVLDNMVSIGKKYYRCQQKEVRGGHTCPGVSVRKDFVENFFAEFAGKFSADLFLNDTEETHIDPSDTIKDRIAQMKSRVAYYEKKIADAKKAFAHGTLDIDSMTEALKDLKENASKAHSEIRQQEILLENCKTNTAKEAIDELKHWKSLNVVQKRESLKMLISEAVMYPDKMVIRLHSRPDHKIIVPYLPKNKHRQRKYFPEVTKELLLFDDEGKMNPLGEWTYLGGRKWYEKYKDDLEELIKYSALDTKGITEEDYKD